MNTNFDEILYDLNTIFSEASKLVMSLNELESKIRHDTESVNSRLNSVQGLLETYEQSASGYKMFYEEFYLPETVVYPNYLLDDEKCVVNNEFGIVTLPVNSSFSKVYTTNISTGEVVSAPDLLISVVPLDEIDSIRVDETSAYRAFDGNDETVWERKVRFDRDSTKSSVRCLMTITMPSMSNPYVNSLYIKPYPEGTGDIQAITYDTTVTQDTMLPSFPVAGENNINSTVYTFNNIQPTKFKIYFRQRTSEIEDNLKTFVYGAREIGIEKVDYIPLGTIGFKFSLPDYETGLLSHITSLTTDPEYDNIRYAISLYTSETDFNNNSPIWVSDNPPITPTNQLDVSSYGLESIWATIEITQDARDTETPILRSITMTYTTT